MKYDFDKVIDRKNTNSIKYASFEVLSALEKTPYPIDEETISLFIADMDIECPESVKEEVLKVANKNLYGYTVLHPSTSKRYYDAVCNWFNNKYDLEIEPDDITNVDGTVKAIALAINGFSNVGDKVLIHTPNYPPFREAIEVFDRVIEESKLKLVNGKYEIDFDDFEKKIKNEDVKIFILCNPHNPTGRVFNSDDLIKMYNICKENNVLIIADEIHGDLTRVDTKFTPIMKLVDGDNLITCTAANKTFNIAGLKATNIIIKNEEIKYKFRKSLFHLMTSEFTIAATIGAYNGDGEWLEEIKKYFDKNFDWVIDFVKTHMPKLKVYKPEATYLLWMDFREYNLSEEELKKRIYKDANLILCDGKCFDPADGVGFQRMCLSSPLETIKKAFFRLYEAFEDIN